jgi:hypothetical protein
MSTLCMVPYAVVVNHNVEQYTYAIEVDYTQRPRALPSIYSSLYVDFKLCYARCLQYIFQDLLTLHLVHITQQVIC